MTNANADSDKFEYYEELFNPLLRVLRKST
jgi:hypothetical protein